MHKNTSLFKRFVALAISLLMVLQMMPVASLAEGLEGYSSVSSDPYGGNEYARVTFRSPGKEEDEYDTVASRDIEIGAALGGLPDVPDGDGYLCTWKAEDGTQVTKDTVIQSNMVVTASLYKEYTFEDQKLSMVIRAPKGRLTEEATPYLQSVALTDEQMAAVVTKAGEDISVLDAINVYFQNKDGEKVQPDQSVSISMHLKTAPTGNVSVVHIPDAPVATRKLMKATKSSSSSSSINAEVVPSSINGQDITFDAGSFSVYAVVESGSTVDEARVTVNFYGTNMTTPVATYYVKNSDVLLGNGERQPNVQYIEDIVIDPGVGATLESNKLFLGWSIDAADANNDANYDTTNYGASYSTNTKHYTVDEIRQYLANKVIRESEVLNIYGMIFNVFTVQYEDPFGVILAEDEVIFSLNETSASYAISQSYSAPDQTHNFEGWNVKTGSTSISNATFNGSAIEAPYPMGTTMTIAGSIVFSVNMSEGHWLIFEENGNNATYNAPIFIKQNEVSREPSLPMVRPGYSFDGWWTGKPAAEGEDPTGSRYTFGQMLEDTTTLYAKWNVDETATYSIIIWVQSVSDDKDAADANKTYDFLLATQKTANSNTLVSSLNLSAYQNKDGQTITVDGKTYSLYGFKYNSEQRAHEEGYVTIGNGVVANSTVVNPEGTTVINLYYDRELVTYDFNVSQLVEVTPKPTGSNINNGEYYIYYNNQYCVIRYRDTNFWGTNRYYLYQPTTSNTGTQYAYVDGTWYQLEYGAASGTNEYYWWYRANGSWHIYTGTRYTQSVNNFTAINNYDVYTYQWLSRTTYTGLYGQKLSKYGYTWPTDYRWFNEIGGNTFTSIQDMFVASTSFYGYETNMNTNVYHYLQNVDDSWPNTATYTIPTVVGNGMVFRSFQGFTESEFRIKLPNGVNTYQTGTAYNGDNLVNPVTHTAVNGWTDWLPDGTGVEYAGNTRHELMRWAVTEGGIEFRYTRNKYDLTYMVGRFVNRNNETLTPPINGKLKTVEDITYESSLASYAEGGENYYNPDTDNAQAGFVFAGWYLDETCTTEAKFDGTMPLNGITVYGKWQQVEYRVFLHPNAAPGGVRDTTLTWGSDSQETSFRVSYNGKVSVPFGTRTGYDFIGWYTDAAFTKPFNKDTRLTDSTVPANPVYDKTVDMTDNANGDDMDKWGLLVDEGINKDVNRFWITRKLDLYGKWSAVIAGADGIGVLYDANGGSNAPNDTRLYKDNVSAVAQGASTPPDNTQQFLYWVVQKWDENTNKYVDITGSDAIVYPGENFTVLLSNSRRVPRLDEDNQPMYDKLGQPLYTYTVQLRAEYGLKEIPTDTHIDWYPNYGSNSVLQTNAGLQINEAVNICAAPTRTGYTFLGWARIPDTQSQSDPGPAVVLEDLGVGDLYLVYHADTNSYTYNNTVVTQVAADEAQPYHDMYAVWGQFGNLKIEKHFDTQPNDADALANTNNRRKVGITITKDGEAVTGLTGSNNEVISWPKTLADFSANEGESWTYIWEYTGVPIGTYTVVESGAETMLQDLDYTLDTTSGSYQGTDSGEVTTDNLIKLKLENHYRGTKAFKVQKLVSGIDDDDYATLVSNHEFQFVIRNSAGKYYKKTSMEGTDTWSWTANTPEDAEKFTFKAGNNKDEFGEAIKVEGLPAGQYTIEETESSAALTGYRLNSSIPTYVVTLQAGNDYEPTAEIRNNYEHIKGKITVKKVVVDHNNIKISEAGNNMFDFTATKNGSTRNYQIPNVKPNDQNGQSQNGVYGGTYSLTETRRVDPAGYQFQGMTTSFVIMNNGVEVSRDTPTIVNEGDEIIFTVTNKYTHHVDVKVQKTFSGINANDIPSTFEIDYTIKEGETTSEPVALTKDSSNLVITGGGLVYTWTVSGVPAGTKFEAEEKNYNATGYKCNTSITDTKKSINFVSDTSENKIEFTNDYSQGSLKVTKEVVSDMPSDHETEFTFTVVLGEPVAAAWTQENVTVSSDRKTLTFKLADGGVMILNNLPADASYTVTETTVANMTVSPEGGVITGSISSTEQKKAEFKNTRNTVTVKLHKKVAGNMGDKNRIFSFDIVVKDKDKSRIVTTENDVALKDWSASPTDDNEWVAVLPVGAWVTISEDDPEYPDIPDIIDSSTTVALDNSKISDELGCSFTVPDKNCVVTYTNKLEIEIDMGVSADSKPYLFLLGLIPLAGFGAVMMARRRRRDEA